VRKLKSEAKQVGGRKGNLREMRITYKWTEADIEFAAFVKRHIPLPDDMVFDEKWDGLIAPTIVKKYTDMRCNVNARVTGVFLGKY
jgi:predicted membrane GTPase involved in stress response